MSTNDNSNQQAVRSFSKIFSSLAALLFLIGTILAIANLPSQINSKVITGTVLDFDIVQNAIPFSEEDSGLQYYPIIEYQSETGIRKFISPVPTKQLSIGQKIELRISKNRVFVNNIWHQWGAPSIFIGLAVLFFICSLALRRLGKPTQP